MNKLVLALCLATSLVVAPAAPAQSCLFSSFSSCLSTFPGGDWFSLALSDYCALTRFILCDFGF
ncbi:MAG TPA: hypothetical protein VK679_17265 [Gemmatimonadaceae bacterium]|jgi:hypothetical protein|nr:hypothetical protein [Gemmatimonadaceae bacterium]